MAFENRLNRFQQEDDLSPEAMAMLSPLMTAAPVEPPADLTDRIMARLDGQRQTTSYWRTRWMPVAAAAVFLLVGSSVLLLPIQQDPLRHVAVKIQATPTVNPSSVTETQSAQLPVDESFLAYDAGDDPMADVESHDPLQDLVGF